MKKWMIYWNLFKLLKILIFYKKESLKQLKFKQQNKQEDFSILLGTLGASLLGHLLAGKGTVRAGSGNKKGKGIVRAGTGKQWDFNSASCFNKLWNTKILSKWTKI